MSNLKQQKKVSVSKKKTKQTSQQQLIKWDKQAIKLSNDKDVLTIDEVAKKLNVSIQRVHQLIDEGKITTNEVANFDKNGRRVKPKKVVKYSDILLFQEQQQQFEITKLNNKTNKMVEKYNDNELQVAFGKTLDNRTPQDILNLSLQMMQVSMQKMVQQSTSKDKIIDNLRNENNDLQKQVVVLLDENKELKNLYDSLKADYQVLSDLKDNILLKQKQQEVRAKINKYIRLFAKQRFNENYKDAYNYFYSKYDKQHNFTIQKEYIKYIDVISERGHLQEFLNIVLSD